MLQNRCHRIGALGTLEPDELVLVASEMALGGQGVAVARRLASERTLFLTDYVNQRGVMNAGLHAGDDGLAAWEMLEAAAAGRLRALVIFADDPFEFFPGLAARAFAGAEFVLVVDAIKTRTAAHADLVLPGALLAEKAGTVVNTEGRAQELAPVAAAPLGSSEGMITTQLLRAFDGDAGVPARTLRIPLAGGLAPEEPSAEYPFLAALDTTAFWSSHALVAATVTAWREARSLFADFPPGWVTLNPEDAHRLGVQYAGAVTLTSREGAVTLPARLHTRMLPGTAWIAMPGWERCGARLGAVAFDPALRIPVFVPRAVRITRPAGR